MKCSLWKYKSYRPESLNRQSLSGAVFGSAPRIQVVDRIVPVSSLPWREQSLIAPMLGLCVKDALRLRMCPRRIVKPPSYILRTRKHQTARARRTCGTGLCALMEKHLSLFIYGLVSPRIHAKSYNNRYKCAPWFHVWDLGLAARVDNLFAARRSLEEPNQ